MNIKITQKQLIIANIFLFVVSFVLIKFGNQFRLNQSLHWIYSYSNLFHLFIGFPLPMIGSIILAYYSLNKLKKEKFVYFFFSLLPVFIFLSIIIFNIVIKEN